MPTFIQFRKTFADPVEIGVADVAPIVEGDFAHSAGAKRPHRRQEFAFCLEIGIGGTQDAPKRSRAAQPTFDVVEVGFDAARARFVEAGFDDPGRLARAP